MSAEFLDLYRSFNTPGDLNAIGVAIVIGIAIVITTAFKYRAYCSYLKERRRLRALQARLDIGEKVDLTDGLYEVYRNR